MKHNMKLHNSPFQAIKNNLKTVEMRLNDEKRQLINEGDEIEFSNSITEEKIIVKVKALYRFSTFNELYNSFNKTELGYKKDEVADPCDMLKYYSKENIEKYGVLAIKIEKN